jgi:MFS family permease
MSSRTVCAEPLSVPHTPSTHEALRLPSKHETLRLPSTHEALRLPTTSLCSDIPARDRSDAVRQMVVLTICSMVYNVALGMCMPLYARFAAHLGLGESAGGLIIAAPCVSRVLLNLGLGSLADGWGRKPLLIGGSLIMAVGAYRAASAYSLWTMLAGRLLIGVGGAASDIAAQACRLDAVSHWPARRGMLLGWAQALSNLGYAAGPVGGGALAARHGVRAPFYVLAYALVGCAVLYILLPDATSADLAERAAEDQHASPATPSKLHKDEGEGTGADVNMGVGGRASKGVLGRAWSTACALLLPGAGGGMALTELVGDARQRSLLLLRFVLTAGWASWMTLLPSHLSHTFAMDPTAVGLALSLMTLIGFGSSPIGGLLADKLGGALLARLSAVASATSLGLLPCAATTTGAWALLSVWEVGTATMGAATSAAAAELTRLELRGTQSSLVSQVHDVTFVLLPTALGLLAARVGTGAALTLTAVLQLAAIAASARLLRGSSYEQGGGRPTRGRKRRVWK